MFYDIDKFIKLQREGEQYKGMFTTDRAKNRAKTFPGIAKAMAEQYGGDIRDEFTDGISSWRQVWETCDFETGRRT